MSPRFCRPRSSRPVALRDLWKWMQNYEDKTGGQVLAIPHSGNLSNGMMFPLLDDFDGGKLLDADDAKTRAR